MNKWNSDMSAAPRDGTPILAWGTYSCLYMLNFNAKGPINIMSVVEFDDGRWRMTTPSGRNPIVDVWENEWDGKQEAFMEPTHWMPLPPPPEGR